MFFEELGGAVCLLEKDCKFDELARLTEIDFFEILST